MAGDWRGRWHVASRGHKQQFVLISDKIAETDLVFHPRDIRLVFKAPRAKHIQGLPKMRGRCPHEQYGVGGGETLNWQTADFVKRHRGIMVACRALHAGFFVVDFEMPRRIGVKHRIASVAWKRSLWVTGCGQPLKAFGAANLRFPRPDILCRPKNLTLAPRHDLALLVYRLGGDVCCR